jgi:hypothetical protein
LIPEKSQFNNMLSLKNFILTKKRVSYSLFLLLLLFLTTATGLQAQCIDVDLQAVSIDPGHTSIAKGQKTTITVVMKNHGSCPIPAGEATAQVTLSAVYLDLGTTVNFSDMCKQWTYLGAVSNAKQHNLFFRNDGGSIAPDGKACSFHFDVKGKAITNAPVAITLASSLSATAKTADVNGNNQSVSTELHVSAVATPPPPELITDFNVTAKECDAILKWKVLSNNAIDSFEIEYGANETQFTKVGAVPVNTTTGGLTYEYTHYQGIGRGNYRLKIIDRDGKFSFSKTVSIDTKCIIKKGFTP